MTWMKYIMNEIGIEIETSRNKLQNEKLYREYEVDP